VIKVHGQIIGISSFEQKGKKYLKLIILDGPHLHEVKSTIEKGYQYAVGEVVEIQVNAFAFRDKVYYSVK